jgi:ribose 5-phosphate isomerase B
MKIYIGTDHRGFELKNKLSDWLSSEGHDIEDCGAHELNQEDDYPDFAKEVSRKVADEVESRGIVICGSGAGVEIVANKIKGIRCSIGFDKEQVRKARTDDNINILALASDYLDFEKAKDLISIFLETEFDPSENHTRRIQKISNLES